MVTEIAKKGTQDLNMFPNAHGVCEHVSPLSLVTGKNTPDYNSMKIEFGSYAQVFEDNDPTNTNKARTVGAIALTATGNTNGDHYFMSLATGSRISRQQWTELPITDNAIARVEALAASEGQPLIQERGLVIEWRPGHVIDDDEYDRDYVQGEHKDDDHGDEDDMEQYDPVDEGEIEDIQAPEGHDAINNGAVDQFVHDPAGEEFDDFHRQFDDENQLIADDQNDHEAQGDNGLLDDQEPHAEPGPFGQLLEQGANVDDENEGAHDEEQGANTPAQGPMFDTGAQGRYNLREQAPRGRTFADAIDEPHSGKSYYGPHQFLQNGIPDSKEAPPTTVEKFIFGFVMTQMSAKAGIKKHGRAAEEALMAEFAQLEELEVFEALRPDTLTRQQKAGALRAINLIKEKRDGRLKGRTVADGRPQRFLYSKAETASPTVSADALMLLLMIDAKEGRDVATPTLLVHT
jgi:hypothetical protein